ncbi:hypothetical protein [Millisia brevis]|uniref:hypothetical protein n=1 Tax=Millisia brevis TaxID=264148 RepID=UPI0008307A6D|nr:hypothetical protein [Millisia brevis]
MSGETVVDPEALRSVVGTLLGAVGALDDSAASMPGTGGGGDAELLLAAMLAAFSSAAVDVLGEGQVLGDLARVCADDYESADAAAAAELLTTTEPGG